MCCPRLGLLLIITLLLFLTALPASASPSPVDSILITAIGWNVESGNADPAVIGRRIAGFEDMGLWGLSEVNGDADAAHFEESAQEGENADYRRVLGTTGGDDRLLVLYNTNRFDYLGHEELHDINIGGNVRAPLVVRLREKESGQAFLFMVNYLHGADEQTRHAQAMMLNTWGGEQTLPAIAVGTYNFSCDAESCAKSIGFGRMTDSDHWKWIKPSAIVDTQCCADNRVQDYVFAAGHAQQWPATSEIVVETGDFPDDDSTSNHRPVKAQFQIPVDISSAPTIPGIYLPVVSNWALMVRD